MTRKKVQARGTFSPMLLLIIVLLWCPSAPLRAAPPDGREWLSEPTIPRESVTQALQEISGMSGAEAERFIGTIRQARETAPTEGKMAAGLLVAVATEKTGDLKAARNAYEAVISESKGTPYEASADFCIEVLRNRDRSAKRAERTLKQIIKKEERSGWFAISNQWTWSTSRKAACHALIERRSDRLSFRLFQFLRSMSVFPEEYAYVFVLLALAIGVKVLEFPLLLKAVKAAIGLRELQSEMAEIQYDAYSGPVEKQQRLMDLYKKRGVNPLGGCAVAFVDLVFVIWALVTLGGFKPQLILDNARFFWVNDVTRFNFSVCVAWLLLTTVTGRIGQGKQSAAAGQLFAATIVSGGIFIGIGALFGWPAYVFVFWILLAVVGLVLSGFLRAAMSASGA